MNRIQTLLCTYPGRIYLHFETKHQCLRFLREAEAEGFTFPDGEKPTRRHPADILALNQDLTINYVGFIGHMAFQAADTIGGVPLHKLEYGELA